MGLGRRLFRGTDPERDSVWRYVNAEGTHPSLREYLEIERRSKILAQEVFIDPLVRSLRLAEAATPQEQIDGFVKEFQRRITELFKQAMFELYKLGQRHGTPVEDLPTTKPEPAAPEGLSDEEILQHAKDILAGKIDSDKLSLSPSDLERLEKALHAIFAEKDKKEPEKVEPLFGGENPPEKPVPEKPAPDQKPLFDKGEDDSSKKKSEEPPEVTETKPVFFDRQTLEMFPLPEKEVVRILRKRGYTKNDAEQKVSEDAVSARGEAMSLLSQKALEIAKTSPEQYLSNETISTLSQALKLSPEALQQKSPQELAGLAILHALVTRVNSGQKIPDNFLPEKLFDNGESDEPEEVQPTTDTNNSNEIQNVEQARKYLVDVLGYNPEDFENMPEEDVIKIANVAKSAGDVVNPEAKGKGKRNKEQQDPTTRRQEALKPLWNNLFGEDEYQRLLNQGYKPYLWFRVPRRKSKQPFQAELIDAKDPDAIEGMTDLYVALKSGDLFGDSVDPTNFRVVKDNFDGLLNGGYQGTGNVFDRLVKAIENQEGKTDRATVIERIQGEAQKRNKSLTGPTHKSVIDMSKGQRPQDAEDDYGDNMEKLL
jgi:hypothetical protein